MLCIFRGVASGWTTSRGSECPGGLCQKEPIGMGVVTAPCTWAPEGLATVVIKHVLQFRQFWWFKFEPCYSLVTKIKTLLM